MNNEIEALFPAYVMGVLTAREQEAVHRYIIGNREAEMRLIALMSAAATPPLDITSDAPSPAVKRRLMERVRLENRPEAPDVPVVPQPANTRLTKRNRQRVDLMAWLRGQSGGFAFAGVALAAALIVAVYALSLNRQIEDQQAALEALERDNQTLEAEITMLADEQAALRSANQTLRTDNALLIADKEAFEADNDQLASANSALQQTNAALQSDVERMEAALTALEVNNVTLADNNETLAAQLAAQQDVLNLLESPDVQLISVPGTETQPDAAAQFIIDPGSDTALLIVDDLTPLDEGEVYQVLLLRGTEHDTAETFMVRSAGQRILVVHSARPLSNFDGVGVSIEPAGGSPQRTGDIVLLGTFALN